MTDETKQEEAKEVTTDTPVAAEPIKLTVPKRQLVIETDGVNITVPANTLSIAETVWVLHMLLDHFGTVRRK